MTETINAILPAVMPAMLLLLAGLGWLYRNETEKRRRLEERLNDKKTTIYEAYITNMTSLFHKDTQESKKNTISERRIFDIVKKIAEFNRFVLVYGSKDIIGVQAEYMSHLHSSGQEGKVFTGDEAITSIKSHFYYLTKAINAMRAELGHRGPPITMDQMARLFITDYVPGTFGDKQ